MILKKNKRLFYITGLVAFIYFVMPFFLYIFHLYGERGMQPTDIFYGSSIMFAGLLFAFDFSLGLSLYIILWLLSWLILYFVCRFIKFLLIKVKSNPTI
jgi:hypothetical protein